MRPLPAKESSSQKLDLPPLSDLTPWRQYPSFSDLTKCPSSKTLQNDRLPPFLKAHLPQWRNSATVLRLLPIILSRALRLLVLYSSEWLLIKQKGRDGERWRRVEQEKAENFPHYHSELWKPAFRQASRKRKQYEDFTGSPGICGTVTAPGSYKPAGPGRPSGSPPCTLMLLKHSGAEISSNQRFIMVPLARPTRVPLFTSFWTQGVFVTELSLKRLLSEDREKESPLLNRPPLKIFNKYK